ncbi:DUF1810 family protein [Bradyrhizobium sp. Arg314]
MACDAIGDLRRSSVVPECIGTLLRLSDLSAHADCGDADARKLHVSLSLFSEANNDEFLFETMFDIWFDGLLDEDTMNELNLMA